MNAYKIYISKFFMDELSIGVLAGFLTMAGVYGVCFGIFDGRRAYKINRKSYESKEKLDGERVIGPFSFMAKRNRLDMYELNPNSLDTSYNP